MLIIMMISGLQYFYAYRALEKSAVENSTNTLQLLKNAHEIVSAQVEQSTDGLLSNSYFLKYMDYYTSKTNYNSMIDMYGQCSNIVSNNVHIKSICIYYRKYGYTLSTDLGVSSLADNSDREFLESLDDMEYTYNMTFSRNVTRLLSKESEDVITIVKTIPIYYTTKYPDAYVLIDIDPAYIENSLQNLVSHPNSSVIVSDAAGNILAQTGNFKISTEELMQLPVSQELSSEKTMINQEECIVSYTQSHNNGLTYVYIQPLSMIASEISALWNSFAIICGATILVSIVGAFLFSYRIFKPIQLIAKRCPPMLDASKEMGIRETDAIMSHLSNLLQTNENLRKDQKDHKLLEKHKQFLQLLQSDWKGDHFIQQIEKLGFVEKEGKEYVLLVTDADISADIGLIKRAEEMLKNRFSELELLFLDWIAPHQFIVLICMAVERNYSVEEIASVVREELGMETESSFGVSDPFMDGKSLVLAYRQACAALDMRVLQGPGGTHGYQEIASKLYLPYPADIDSRIFTALKRGNWENVLTAMEDFQNYAISNHADPNTVRGFYLQLFCAIQNLVLGMGKLLDQMPQVNYLELIYKTSIQDMNDFLCEYLRQLMQCISSKMETRYTRLLQEVCEYIDKHLGDDLSIDRIGEKFSVSASNLRRIFKSEMNTTIKDYIDNRKVEKAKEYLASNKLKIQDIAVQLGFLYSQSFINFFKSMTGMTPGEYRFSVNHESGPEDERNDSSNNL